MNPQEILSQAIQEAYKGKAVGVWALFSGGHDSLVATWEASHHPQFRGVVHIDTGIGIPETTQYVKDMCERYSWQLIIKSPNTTYEMLVIKGGFPTPPLHSLMYRMLKERSIDTAKNEIRKLYPDEAIVFATGIRREESRKRAESPLWRVYRNALMVSPIADYKISDLARVMTENNLPRNAVKDRIGISGECLCGAHASPSELALIRHYYPATGERIDALQELVEATALYYERHGGGCIKEQYRRWGNQQDAELPDDLEDTLCSGCATSPINREMQAVRLLKRIKDLQ